MADRDVPDQLVADIAAVIEEANRLKRRIYSAFYAVHPAQRGRWIMSQATLDRLDAIFTDEDVTGRPKPEPPEPGEPVTTTPYLMGLPIQVKEGHQGMHVLPLESPSQVKPGPGRRIDWIPG